MPCDGGGFLAWFCPVCEQIREDGQLCPADGTFATDGPREEAPPTAAPPEAPWRAGVLEERQPVDTGRFWPLGLWLAAGFVAVGLAERFLRSLASGDSTALALSLGLLAGLCAVGLAARLRPNQTRSALRWLVRPLVPFVLQILPRNRLRRRLVLQRAEDGALVGLEVDDPAPWPLRGGAVFIEGRYRTPEVAVARRLTRGPGGAVLSVARLGRGLALPLAIVGAYLLVCARLGWQ